MNENFFRGFSVAHSDFSHSFICTHISICTPIQRWIYNIQFEKLIVTIIIDNIRILISFLARFGEYWIILNWFNKTNCLIFIRSQQNGGLQSFIHADTLQAVNLLNENTTNRKSSKKNSNNKKKKHKKQIYNFIRFISYGERSAHKKKITKNENNKHTCKAKLLGKVGTNKPKLQYDISLFESFILLFDINANVRRCVCKSLDLYVSFYMSDFCFHSFSCAYKRLLQNSTPQTKKRKKYYHHHHYRHHTRCK